MKQPSLIERMQKMEQLAKEAEKAETVSELRQVVAAFLREQIKEAQEDALLTV